MRSRSERTVGVGGLWLEDGVWRRRWSGGMRDCEETAAVMSAVGRRCVRVIGCHSMPCGPCCNSAACGNRRASNLVCLNVHELLRPRSWHATWQCYCLC